MLAGRFTMFLARWAASLAVLVCIPACSSGSASSPTLTAGTPPATSSAPTTAAPSKHRHRRARRKHRRAHHARHAARAAANVPAVDMPNHSLTPGVALPAAAGRICVSGYASSVRDVPQAEKDAVYAEYGVVDVPYAHEVDHLISLELGGSNAIANLWPEPYAGRWGAGTKDQLENRLHDLVCAGTLSLGYAQHIEATNWVAAYRRYVSSTPPAAPRRASGSGSASGGGSGKCTPGYSPCLVDHGGADYDCHGEGGNGPYFTAPGVTYTVTGSDPYHLDGNHDGRACGS